MDPRRKRLTVNGAVDVKGDTSPRGGKSPRGPPNKLQAIGLAEVFSSQELAGAKAVLITSLTDKDMARKRSFGSKDEEVTTPPGLDERAMHSWVKSMGFGWACKKGLKPESPNQDSFSLLCVEGQFNFLGIFDGHGPDGHSVSDLARRVLLKLFIQHEKRSSDPGKALTETFIQTQNILEHSDVQASASGTTCTVAYHDVKANTITIAHVGDSRSVIGKGKDWRTALECQDLTIDHKPNLEKERKRIESAKPPGRVVFDGYYNHRVFAQNGMYPGLNMSRALGDVVAHKEAGLTAEPDVITIDLTAEKARNPALTLLLCTDGVWEFIESAEAVKLVNEKDSPDQAAEALAKEGWDRWMKDSENEISDDITVICMRL